MVSDEGAPETLLTDEVALTSILRNLLSNGIKYTDRGEVQLSVRVAGPRLELTRVRHRHRHPGRPVKSTSSRSSTRCPGPAAAGPGWACRMPAGWPGILGGDLVLSSQPGAGTTVVLDCRTRPRSWVPSYWLTTTPASGNVLRGLLTGMADRSSSRPATATQALAVLAEHHGRPGPGRPEHARHGRRHAAGPAARLGARDRGHQRPTRPPRRGRPRCSGRTSSPGSGWSSPSAA